MPTTLSQLIEAAFSADVLNVETEAKGETGTIKCPTVQFVRLNNEAVLIHSAALGAGRFIYHTISWHANDKNMKGTDHLKLLANGKLHDVTIERKKHRTVTVKAVE